jgi:hypothetical protein
MHPGSLPPSAVAPWSFSPPLWFVCLGARLGRSRQLQVIEAEELKTALAVARKQLTETEAKVAALEKSREALQQSVAEANRVTEEIRAQYEELLLRMASFGVDLVKPDPKSLEQRLLGAVRDRDAAERQKQDLARHLVQVSEAAVAQLQSTVPSDPQTRASMERELAGANEALRQMVAGEKPDVGIRPLSEGQVVSFDPELGLVVLNIGRQSGVRIGMPLNVKRAEKTVGTALVVDVRDGIAGALLQEIGASQEVKVGDRIEPRPDAL